MGYRFVAWGQNRALCTEALTMERCIINDAEKKRQSCFSSNHAAVQQHLCGFNNHKALPHIIMLTCPIRQLRFRALALPSPHFVS